MTITIDLPDDLVRQVKLRAVRWMDAYLAAFAISAALPLLSLDRDFEAFRSAGLCLERLDCPTER